MRTGTMCTNEFCTKHVGGAVDRGTFDTLPPTTSEPQCIYVQYLSTLHLHAKWSTSSSYNAAAKSICRYDHREHEGGSLGSPLRELNGETEAL